MRAVVTGATGTVGRRLLERLDGSVTVLTRNPARAARLLRAERFVAWDGRSPLDSSVFDGADAVFHLAGESVADGRWSAEKKRAIHDSRVAGTRAVVQAMGRAQPRPRALVSASAVGLYGTQGGALLSEASAAGSGFLADVCQAWEREADAAARDFEIRTVLVRIGIVLSRDGGALSKMLPLFELGLGGKLGSGEQWMPWVHVDDVVGLLLHAATRSQVSGPLNAVAPEPVQNAEFTRALGRALGRPAFWPVPAAALRLVMGEMADMVLSSQRVVPEAALASGYHFRYPELAQALGELIVRGAAGRPVEART